MISKLWGEAQFVYRPRTLDELKEFNGNVHKEKYKIVKVIELSSKDYSNFITDMLADRLFIEENEALCSKGDVWECLLVKRKGAHEGILIMPQNRCFVGYAAFYL